MQATSESLNAASRALQAADDAFFTEAFTNPVTLQPDRVPEPLRRLSARLCRSYGIRGICDPMYIANIVAVELGLGDGLGHFTAPASIPAPITPANVLPFVPAAVVPEASPEPVAAIVATAEPTPRSPREWVTTGDLRQLLKSALGYNAKQVTAKCRHSQQYLDLTIRDASVDVAAVRKFAASFNTWSMDQTDYVTGQSVNVSTTSEVDAIHAAPFMDEARDAVARITSGESGTGTRLSNGKLLWKQESNGGGYYVSRDLNGERGQYVYIWDVENGTPWAIAALALQIARV